jgi:hypothetical protein
MDIIGKDSINHTKKSQSPSKIHSNPGTKLMEQTNPLEPRSNPVNDHFRAAGGLDVTGKLMPAEWKP